MGPSDSPNADADTTRNDATILEKPDVRRFGDYRVFLNAHVAWLRQEDRKFSFRRFARSAGFSSPNYLKLVMDGDRNLSVESAPKFATGLGLSDEDGEVFTCLVALASARHDTARNAIYADLRERTRGEDFATLRDDQFAVYDHWWVLPVRDMVALPDFRCDAEWIAQRIHPRIRPAMAQKAIDLLFRLGMWVRDPDTGAIQRSAETVSSGLDPTALHGLAIRNYHRAHLELAARSLDEVPRDERNVTSAILTLDATGYAEAVEAVTRLRRTLLDIASRRSVSGAPDSGVVQAAAGGADGEGQRIYQILLALFPVTGEGMR